jgi:hypothetical protein
MIRKHQRQWASELADGHYGLRASEGKRSRFPASSGWRGKPEETHEDRCCCACVRAVEQFPGLAQNPRNTGHLAFLIISSLSASINAIRLLVDLHQARWF